MTNTDKDRLVQIVAGLLASGHFTKHENPEDNESPFVVRCDFGKDWKENGERERRPHEAVVEALEILECLDNQTSEEINGG